MEKEKTTNPNTKNQQQRSRTHSERSDDSRENHSSENARSVPAPQKSGNSIFGGAKPVDTTRREREIEEKLKKVDIDSEKSGPRNNSSNHDRHTNSESNSQKKVRSPPPPKEYVEDKPAVSFTDARQNCYMYQNRQILLGVPKHMGTWGNVLAM